LKLVLGEFLNIEYQKNEVMKNILLGVLFLWAVSVNAQTITMSNNCTKMLQQAERYNDAKMFDSALAVFTSFDGKCKAKDARFKGGAEKAHAFNGLGKYNEALDAANAAVKANNRWISGYFERAVAYAGLGMTNESKADYNKIIELSGKNQNTNARASIYAMLADISFKQGEQDSAFAMVDSALVLKKDPKFMIQKGDMFYANHDYEPAFMQYYKAMESGRNDYDMALLITQQRMRVFQKKYGTDNVNELSKKMNSQEKNTLCKDIEKMRSFSVKNMTWDMTNAILCQ
jgi:tetratricopeptide (TPR) repeat protein